MGQRTVRALSLLIPEPLLMSVMAGHSIRVQFPDDPSATPLRVIRDKLAEHTGLAPDRFKLIKSGAIMKDDNAPLSAYGLKPGSTIALVGSGEGVDADIPASSSSAGGSKLGHGKNQARSPPTEQSTLQSIKTELDTVRTSLEPSVTSFLSSLSSPASQSPEQPPQEDAKVTHTRLGELLLQSLLRLDAILPESEWTEVRSARKNAVKEVQALLDQLDDGWRSASSSQSS